MAMAMTNNNNKTPGLAFVGVVQAYHTTTTPTPLLSSSSPIFVPRRGSRQKLGRSAFVSVSSAQQQLLPPDTAFITQPPQWSFFSHYGGKQNRKRRSITTSTSTTTMLIETSGGMEALQDYLDQADNASGSQRQHGLGGLGRRLSKHVRNQPSVWKFAQYASVPLTAALGFGLVPSRRFAAHAVGAVVSGIAGAVGQSRIRNVLTETSAQPAMVALLLEQLNTDGRPLSSPDQIYQRLVENVQDPFGLLEEDFELLCTQVYALYVRGMVQYNPTPKTTELKELDQLRRALHLNHVQLGEAHHLAALEWYRTTLLFTPEEELDDITHPDRQALDKLLFLSERALRTFADDDYDDLRRKDPTKDSPATRLLPTHEAFVFEMTRVAKALHLDFSTALERVADVVEPFYQRALTSTRSKLLGLSRSDSSSSSGSGTINSSMLRRARQTLGISNETAHDLHVAAFNQEVRALLGMSSEEHENRPHNISNEAQQQSSLSSKDKSVIKFADGALERLTQLRDILELSETDAAYEIALEATPLFQATAVHAMEAVLDQTKTPEQAWAVMQARRAELLLPPNATKDLLSSMVMQALGKPLESALKFAKVNNVAATYEHLIEALEAKHALLAILTQSGWDEFETFDETFCNPWNRQSANGFLTTDERVKLYKIFMSRSVLRKTPDGTLTDALFDEMAAIKGLLGITDQQQDREMRATFGPELLKVMQNAQTEMVQDYTPELAAHMRKELQRVVTNYRLSNDFVREVGASFYAKAVAMVSETSPGGIPTKDLSAALEALRELFCLSTHDTFPSHNEYFGTVYKKSVLEAMGTTGVIRPEFRASLEDLKLRLGIGEADCRKLFCDAVTEKMKPMVEWIGSEMERTMLSQQQLSKRRGRDMGQDMFHTGKGADGVLGLGAEINVMSDIMELIDFYLENDITTEAKVSQSTQDGQEEIVTKTVYPVTALGSAMIDQEMAELLYRQFIVAGFTSQGDKAARYESNRAIFAGILGLDEAKVGEINSMIGSTVYDNFVSNAMKTKGSMDPQDMMFLANIQSKLNISAEEGEKMLMNAQKKILSEEVNALLDDPTPEGIKMFREKCNGMGIDLTEDVGVSKARLVRMFESEISPGLKDGTINVENSDILGEIQESLGVDPEECETMFESVLLRLSKNAFEVIKGELLRGREDNTVDLIKEIVRYAAFTEGELGLVVDEATANQILNVYEALDFTGQDAATVEVNTNLLRSALGLQ